jgi:hypothetical protein
MWTIQVANPEIFTIADHVYMDKIGEIYLPVLQINLIVYIIILGIRIMYYLKHE